MKQERCALALMAAAWLVGLCCLMPGTASAQPRDLPSPPWLLEIDTGYSVRHRELVSGLRRHFLYPMRDESRDDQAEGPNQWVILWEREGEDALFFRFYLAPSGFEGSPTPEQLEKAEKVLIRQFSMRLGDAVYLTELRDLGFHPLSLRLVLPDAGVPPPPVSIETPSLELTSVRTSANRVELTLVNRSLKAILNLHSDACPEVYSMPTRPLLSAGGERTLKCGLSLDANHRPHPSRIVVASILFDDFSYEGDPAPLRQVLAYYTGVHLSLPAMIARLRARLDQARDDARGQDIAQVLNDLIDELFGIEVAIPEGLAEEFAHLAGEPELVDRWRQSLEQATSFVPRSFAQEMQWFTRRLIDREIPQEHFWNALEQRLARYQQWLESFQANPPGPLF